MVFYWRYITSHLFCLDVFLSLCSPTLGQAYSLQSWTVTPCMSSLKHSSNHLFWVESHWVRSINILEE